jgi:O-antigen/teichoic acid export membrane protein
VNLSINKILRNAFTAVGTLLLAKTYLKSSGLIVGQFIGDLAATLLYCFRFFKGSYSCQIRISDLKKVAGVYKDFPLYSAPATIFDTLSQQLPILLLSSWFGASATGNYFFAVRVLSVPMALVGASISQVFYQRFTGIVANHVEEAKQFLYSIWIKLFLIGVLPLSVIFFFGSSIFKYVFGAEYLLSGQMASILSPYILSAFISSPTSSAMLVLRMQRIGFIFSILVFIYRTVAITIGYYQNDLLLGIKILVVCEIAEICLYNVLIARRLCER